MATKKKDLKASIEAEIAKMLTDTQEPSEGRMKLLALGIKMCALNAKIEEQDYGDFFRDEPDAPSVPLEPGPKPAARKRANGGAAPE